jgi:hypothetical protein
MKKTYSFDLAAKKLQDCNVIATQPADAESSNVSLDSTVRRPLRDCWSLSRTGMRGSTVRRPVENDKPSFWILLIMI